MITFSVPGDAISFQTKTTRFKRGKQMVAGTRKTSAAADWEAEVRSCAAEAMCGRPMIEGPVMVLVECRFALPASRYLKTRIRPAEWKTTKPDTDKVLRLVLDAMEKVVYPHDAQVAWKAIWKVTAAQGEPASTQVTVAPLRASMSKASEVRHLLMGALTAAARDGQGRAA